MTKLSPQGVNLPPISKESAQVLRILSKNQYTAEEIANHLNISRKTVYKHIHNLTKKGYYDRKRGGVTKGGDNFLGYQKDSKFFRSHAYEVYYLLPHGTDKSEWKRKRGSVLTTNKLKWERVDLKSKQGLVQDSACKFFVHGLQAIAYANGVYVWFPSELAESPSAAAKLQLDRIIDYGHRLTKLFRGIDFMKDNRLNVQIRKSEIAHIKDIMAHELRVAEKKLYVHIDNELRVICDFSHNIDEWETVSVGHGVTDHHCLESYKDNISANGDLKAYTNELSKSNSQSDYIKDILTRKSEDMPNHESGIFLPSEVVRLFSEQAKRNAELTSNLTHLSNLFATFGGNIERYGRQIDKHLEMVGNVSELAATMANESRATTDLVNQLYGVVKHISGGRWKPRRVGQRSLSEWG